MFVFLPANVMSSMKVLVAWIMADVAIPRTGNGRTLSLRARIGLTVLRADDFRTAPTADRLTDQD